MPFYIQKSSILIFGISLVSLLASCAKEVSNIRPGMFHFDSSYGVLVGSIDWRQGGRRVGTFTNFDFENLSTHKKYFHITRKIEYWLAVPQGEYSLSILRITNPKVRKTFGRQIAGTLPLLFFLLNQYTLPYGLIIAPSTDNELKARPNLPTFIVKRQEATYLGHLIIEIPDPLPAGSLQPQIRVIDPDNFEIETIKRTLSGIKRVEKRILVSSPG